MKANELVQYSSIKKSKNTYINYNLTILYYLILFYLINLSNEQNSNSISKAILTIKGPGNQRVLANSSLCSPKYTLPDEIYINNNYQIKNNESLYYLSKQINNVTMIWNTQVLYCNCMFRNLSNITYIDLSSFNTSSITYMFSMFNGCSSLISLNLNNFITSSVTFMQNMFKGCSSLISLNINNKLIKEEYKCIDYCSNHTEYKYEYNNICYETCPDGTHTSSINEFLCEDNKIYVTELFNNNIININITKDEMQNNIKEQIINGNLDELINQLVDNTKEDLIIEDNDIKFEITITKDNYNEYKNISIIKLDECEDILKNFYNISKDESLIILKTDIYEKGALTPKMEYEVYDMKNKSKLNLDLCKNTKIELLLPCIIDENNEFKYNIKSDYYNDICYSYKTENGTDNIVR